MFALHCKDFFTPSLLQSPFFTTGWIRDGKEDSYPLSSTLSTRLCQTFRSASTYQFPQGEHLKCSYCFAAFLFPKVDPPEAQSFVELQKIKNMQQVEMDCNFLSKQFIYVNFEFSRMPRVLTVPLHTFSSLTCQWIPVIWMG